MDDEETMAIAVSLHTWMFMRLALYADNLLWTLPHAIATGTLATATANRSRHWITREDCARADAAALASTETVRQIHEITSPAAVTGKRTRRHRLGTDSRSCTPILPRKRRAHLTAATLPR